MNDKLMPILAVTLAVYLVIISVVAVCITIRDKNIAIANGRLEDKGKNVKSGSKGKQANKSSSKKSGEKKSAKGKTPQRRVPENTLLTIAGLGGSIAMLITMRAIRHKTQHMKFMVGIPVIIVLQCLLVVVLVILL